jgi:hypothetical protein
MSDFFEEYLDTRDDTFQITDDRKADWAIEKVLEKNAERDRLLAIADAKIKEIQAMKAEITEKVSKETSYLTSLLFGYFQTITPKQTKTQSTYPLLTGKLVLKKQNPEFVRDEKEMLPWVENNAPEMVKVKKEVAWGELKKLTTVDGENVVLESTGEVIPGVKAVARDDVFEVTK